MSTMIDQERMTLPKPLPWCDYPTARDFPEHGIQLLPRELPLTNLASVGAYRSSCYKVTTASSLEDAQILQMARVVAFSFALREPMLSHVQPPREAPAGLDTATHTDPFGSDSFGPGHGKISSIGSLDYFY